MIARAKMLFVFFTLLLAVTAQQDVIVTPSNNQSFSLSIYSSDANSTLRWTISNPCTSTCTPATIFSIDVLPPHQSWFTLAFSSTPPIPIQQLTVATIRATINSGLVLPGRYNQTINVVYSFGAQRASQMINVTVNCLQNLTLSRTVSRQIAQQFNNSLSIGVGDSIVHQIRIQSLINQPVILSVDVNDQFGNLSIDSVNHPDRPLLSVSPSSITFNPTNWNRSQSFIVSSIATNLIYGSRWSLLNFTYQTNESSLIPFSNLFQSVNVSIIETNQAGIVIRPSSLSLMKNSPPQSIQFSLSCQPRGLVQLQLANNPWFYMMPSLMIWQPDQWNQSIQASLNLYSDYSLGSELISVPMPQLSSRDPDFNHVPSPSIVLRMSDPDPSYASFAPTFGPPGTNITITWSSPLTFQRLDPSQPQATVICVFGSDQYVCNTTASGFCPVFVPAAIINSHQASCIVPTCTPNLQQDRPCYSPATFQVTLNGQAVGMSTNLSTSLSNRCAAYRPANGACMITPTLIYTNALPVPSECMGVGCTGFPSHFIYLALPVITKVAPSDIDLNVPTSIAVVLTILGAPPFTATQAVCNIGGAITTMNAFDEYLANSTYPASVSLNCLTPKFTDKLGSSSSIALPIEVSLTGQPNAYSSSGFVIQGVDHFAVKQANDVIIFLVCCLIAAFSVLGLGFQHYFCRNCRRVHHDLTKRGKQRGEKGPQRLIDMLEPRVKIGAKIVAEEDARREAADRELQRRVDEAVKKLKSEREAKSAAAKQAIEARQSVIVEQERARRDSAAAPPASPQPKSRFAKAKMMLSMMRADKPEVTDSPKSIVQRQRSGSNDTFREQRSASVFGRFRSQTEAAPEEPALEGTLTGI